MPAYTTLAPYIQVGYPRENGNTGSIGNIYKYRGPSATLLANKPIVGTAWADSRPVSQAEYAEFSAASGIAELVVTTALVYGGTVIGNVLEEVVYELQWRPVVKPLEVHPYFDGSLVGAQLKHLLGWRAELDPTLRSQYKYKALDSNGDPSSTTTTIGAGPALDFITLSLKGVEEYVDYMPVWRKRSMYRGSYAPGTGSVGDLATPSGSGYPSGYEWVKSADTVERIGRSSKWKRDEEWEGCIEVLVDRSSIYL